MIIDYNFQGRLQYIPGGPLYVQMSAWPSVLGANWWEPTTGSFTCVAAYQAKGAASLAASYVNLANPGTNDAAPGNAPTFDTSYGWAFNGSTNYLVTGIVPASGWSMFVRFNDASAAVADLAGAQQAPVYFGLAPYPGGGNHYYSNGGYTGVIGNLTNGVMAVAGQDAYLNGVSEGIIGESSWSGFTTSIYIGRRNGQAVSVNAKIQAVAIYSTTLDATQMAEITANMNAL